MAITVETLKFFQSERMTDFEDGGGLMTATEIVSGASNQIFDDLSDVDFAAGDVSLRKIYAAVTSSDTDKYLDAGVVLAARPTNSNVSVLLTSTGSYFDERDAIQDYLESYLVRGPRYAAWLYGTQMVGSRVLLLFGRVADDPPAVNTTLVLVEFTDINQTTESYSQYVRIARVVENSVQTFTRTEGTSVITYQRRIMVVELTEDLRATYHGAEVQQSDAISTLAAIYGVVVADAVRYFGARPLVAEATQGDLTVYADGIYERIVPVAQTETPYLDYNAASERTLVYPGSASTLAFSIADAFSPNFAFSVGRAVVPGSLSITISGGTLVDDGGDVLSGSTAVATINYSTGLITFASSSPTYLGTKTVTFQPAAAFVRPTNSAGLPIEESTRYRVYVTNLKPIPQRGTLVVDYLSQGNWYRLSDAGNGILAGAAESYGTGTVNFSTGSVSLTLGALPDVYSTIIFQWASGADALATPETTTVVFRLNAESFPLDPGTLTLTRGATVLTDQGDGTFTGAGGSATINYATGEIDLTLDTLPNLNSTITLAGDRFLESFAYVEVVSPTPVAGVITVTLLEEDLVPGSLFVTYNRRAMDAFQNSFYERIVVNDDGIGGWSGGVTGTVDYENGSFILDTNGDISEYFRPSATSWVNVNGWGLSGTTRVSVPIATMVALGMEIDTVLSGGEIDGDATVMYRTASTTESFSDDWTITALSVNLKSTNGTQLLDGSLRFTLGGRTYYDLLGNLYYGFDPLTGSGTPAGTLDRTTGQATITAWADASSSSMVIQSRIERLAYSPATSAWFRVASAPVATESFSFRVSINDSVQTVLEASADDQGVISGTAVSSSFGTVDAHGYLDYQTGTVMVYFGEWVDAAGVTGEPWYHADLVNDDGDILHPKPVLLDTLLYNAVSYANLPLDSSIIGLDPVRMPSDGRVPILRDGQLALVHHTATINLQSLSPTQEIDCGRERLYRVAIFDDNDAQLPSSFYTVNREDGLVTMVADLNLTGYPSPYVLYHTIGDLSVILDADLSGQIALTKALSHTFPANTSLISSVLYTGTLQARYTSLFAQSTWTSVWSDTLIGSEPLAQYNDLAYPIQVTNAGAYKDRILIKFTSSSAFQGIGENLGIIGTGDTSGNFAPVNPLTGLPYFTLDYRGWGSGWATGNCLRFNVISANTPVDVIRAVQPSSPTGQDDTVQLLFIGNVDA
jgi:hypothetical protein